jgi:hypothetical protein
MRADSFAMNRACARKLWPKAPPPTMQVSIGARMAA